MSAGSLGGFTAAPVAPPTPQEISRKLSVHSRPQKIPQAPVSGTESDSDSVLSPDLSPPPTTGILAASLIQPLSSIAERRSGSGEGEESDEDEEDEVEEEEWRVDDGRKLRKADGDSVIKTGYLWKKGERRKTWKKRWFVLRPAHLAFYKSSAEYQLLRLLDLSDIHACTPVTLKRHPNSFGLVSPTRTYYLQAESSSEVQTWVSQLNAAREALMSTTTQNSVSTPPIPIPGSSTRYPPPPPITPSPPSYMGHHHPVTSESESEDAFPLSTSPVPIATSPSRGLTNAPKDPTKMILQGYLMKCRSKRRNWRKRWFVLTGEKLMYSASHMDTKRQRAIPLVQILDALEYDLPVDRQGHGIPSSATSPPLSSSLPKMPEDADGSHGKHTFKVVTTKRSLLLCAPSEEEEIKWLSAVRALIARRSGPASPHGSSTVAGGGGGGANSKTTASAGVEAAAYGHSVQHTASGSGSGSGGGGVKISGSIAGRRRSASATSAGLVGGSSAVDEQPPEKI